MEHAYYFGIGIRLSEPFEFSNQISIRPVKLGYNHIELQDFAKTQVDYGFLVALADFVTFELKVSGDDAKDAAIKGWNAQWLFVLLSTVIRRPVFHPIVSWKPAEQFEKGCCDISNVFLSGRVFHQAYEISPDDLNAVKRLQPAFDRLTKENAFSHACTVAAHNFNEPKLSVRMAAIWSGIEALINVQSELSYRIPLICSLILTKPPERIAKFKHVQTLYNARSKCVHGSAGAGQKLDEELSASLNLLCDLIRYFLDRGALFTASELKELPLAGTSE